MDTLEGGVAVGYHDGAVGNPEQKQASIGKEKFFGETFGITDWGLGFKTNRDEAIERTQTNIIRNRLRTSGSQLQGVTPNEESLGNLETSTYQTAQRETACTHATTTFHQPNRRLLETQTPEKLGRQILESSGGNSLQVGNDVQHTKSTTISQSGDNRIQKSPTAGAFVAPIEPGGCNQPDGSSTHKPTGETCVSDRPPTRRFANVAYRLGILPGNQTTISLNSTDRENERHHRSVHHTSPTRGFNGSQYFARSSYRSYASEKAICILGDNKRTHTSAADEGGEQHGSKNQDSEGSTVSPQRGAFESGDRGIRKPINPTPIATYQRQSVTNVLRNGAIQFQPEAEADRHDTIERAGCDGKTRSADDLSTSFVWGTFRDILKINSVPTINRPQTDEDWQLPLHVKSTKEIDLAAAASFIIPERRQFWDKAYKAIFDPMTLENAINAAQSCNVDQEADVSHADISWLLKFNYIEKFEEKLHGEIKGWVRCRTEMEKPFAGKFSRRRFLAVPEALNSYFQGEGYTPLKGVAEHIAEARTLDGGAFVSDAPAFYRQFVLPTECRRYYAFHHDGRTYVLRTIPTGHRMAPALADSLMYSCMTTAKLDSAVSVASHIDNVRILGPKETVEPVIKRLKAITDEIQLELDFEERWKENYSFIFHYCSEGTKLG